MKFVIFQTKWGWFGLAGTETAICRTFLPVKDSDLIKSCFLKEFPDAKCNKNLFKNLQNLIIAYFEGKNVDFNTDVPVFLNAFGDFSKRILIECRNIKSGQTITYADLAEKAGYPKAGRAVGNALAKNPIPLIIPCHRVIRADGKLGGFSATGGKTLKKRLLLLEKHTL
ncbi:MAG: methylated-DNA--[protein]-cysteine S-methyltransferase [Sedimentisphaerales bacterium]|nr:methylated-DNA--[protein]-cysteine S-methyltransferase [Sedimentisphaerales bacterium]